jgi:hypothetical protein
MWDVEAEDDPGTAAAARGGDDEESAADALLREIARLRRKLALMTGDKSPISGVDSSANELEIGFVHNGDPSEDVERSDGRSSLQRPGAFPVRGLASGGNDATTMTTAAVSPAR